jgi:hypothetical protein
LLALSDGAAEATNDQDELFMFDRVMELVRTELSAKKIAETVQALGRRTISP